MVASQDDRFDDVDDECWSPGAEADLIDDDIGELVTCPHCGCDVYEEAEQCPHCGDYIVHRSSSWAGRPVWWIVVGLLGILATLIALTLAN